MSNMQRLLESGNRNLKLFADTILTMKQSQGFYGRLCQAVNELDDDGFTCLSAQLEQQTFNDTLDVVFWLEC